MTPADETVTLSTAASVEENLDRIRDTPHSRFPLLGQGSTDFEGVVYAPSIVSRFEALRSGAVTFEEIAAPPIRCRRR